MNNKFIGLSIDGGGYRGIIPAFFIKEFEKDSNKKAYNVFDLIVGTSTGGIIATSIAKGLSGEEILNIYLKEGENIFKRNFFWKLNSLFGLSAPKYDNQGLIKVINKYLGNDKTTDSKVKFITTAYNVIEDFPFLFKSWENRNYTFSDVAIATASAPTYFANYKSFIDGGVYANNPSIILLIEALKLNFDLKNIIIVSIGTGIDSYSFYPENWGVKEWLSKNGNTPLLNVMFKGQSIFTNEILNYLLNDNFIRLDIEIPKKIKEIDNIKNREELLNIAQTIKDTKQYQKILQLV